MATLKLNILFIGYGHLAKSLLSNNFLKKYNIYAVNSKKKFFPVNSKKNINQKNITYKYIFLLVRPDVFLKEKDEFRKFINYKSKIISCIAGIKLSTISNSLNTKNVIRIMPNIMSKQNKSQTFIYAKNKKLLDENFNKLISIFGSNHYVSKEDQINIATAVFGSGPAFIAFLINSYFLAAKNLSPNTKLKDSDLINLFKNVLSTNSNSNDLDIFSNSIASKKGTTHAGIKFLKSQNIEKIIYVTLEKAYKRSKELSIEK